MVRIERASMPKKSAQKVLIFRTFLHFLTLFDTFLHFLTFFDVFLHFFALFFLPILPNHPDLAPQSLFLAHKQGFSLKSAKISPQNPSNFKNIL